MICLKKIHSIELSFLLFYILQAFLFNIFLPKSISYTSYNFILYLVISIFLGIGVIMLFSYLFNLSNRNIFYNIKNKFIAFILTLIPFIFAIFSLINISSYINYIYLKDIDKLFIIISFMLVVFCFIKNDIYSFFRCSTIIFYFYIFLEIITFILLLFYVDFDNILPINYDLNNIMDYSYLFICFLIIPILFLLVVPKASIKNNSSISRKIFITYLIISLIIGIKSIISISILGYNSMSIYNYPDVVIYKNINLFSFVERFEWLLCFNSITNMFFIISLSLFYVKEGFNYILPIKKNISYLYPLIICIGVILLSYFLVIDFSYIVSLLVLFFLIHLVFGLFKLIK